MTPKKRLPIGIQTFRTLREGGYYYVDKTAFAWRLVEEGSRYFLSRPRRFGKSLFLDTLNELFEGNEPLFRGLAIHDRWDWSVRRPVLRLSFGGAHYLESGALAEDVRAQLDELESNVGIAPSGTSEFARFRRLIRTLHRDSGRRVAVLVDEYDKPVLDCVRDPDAAVRNRGYLRGLYGNLKQCDASIRFLFVAGVSKFTKVSLFSDLNNLIDITLDPPFSSICGYTENDLDEVFGPELAGHDRDAIREFYNGYSWAGEERVYNPFGLLLFFRRGEFRHWWFETATPAFLVEALRGAGIPSFDLERMRGDEGLLSRFEIEEMEPEALLFQTGYLTIREVRHEGYHREYRLGFPNREIREALNEYLLEVMTPRLARRAAPAFRLAALLAAGDFPGVEAHFRALFAAIPYEWHTRNEIARYEGYYASVFYSHIAAAGLPVVVEDSTSRGRVDLTVRLPQRIVLFEFKVVEDEPRSKAIAQLRATGYADKYRAGNRPVTLAGVEFSTRARNIAAFTVAPA